MNKWMRQRVYYTRWQLLGFALFFIAGGFLQGWVWT